MTWEDKYDKINTDDDGYLYVFGGHYTAEQCRDIVKEDNYDDPELYSNFVEHVYVKFGFVHIDCENVSGWRVMVEHKPGRIKATSLYTKKQYKLYKEMLKR